MAKTFHSIAIGKNNVHNFWLTIDVNGSNIQNRTSNVTLRSWLNRNDGYANSSYRNYNDCMKSMDMTDANGTRNVFYTETANIDTRNGAHVLIAEWTGDVQHNPDGTLTLAVSSYFRILDAGSLNGTYAIHGLAELPRVNVASEIAGISGSTIGLPVDFSIRAFSTDVTHRLYFAFGNLAGEISNPWTPPMDLCEQIPAAELGFGTITLETYRDGELIGSTGSPITLYVPASVKPTVRSVSASPVNDNAAIAGWGIFVQNYSRARLNVDAEGIYGSSILWYEVSCTDRNLNGSGTPQEPYTSPKIGGFGTVVLEVVAVDSRERRSEKAEVSFPVSEYSPPALLNANLFRSDGTKEMDSGTQLGYQATCRFASCGGHNTAVLRVLIGDSNEILTADATHDQTFYGHLNAGLSPMLSFSAAITLTDALGQKASFREDIPTERWALHMRDEMDGARFGGVSQGPGLQVDWDTHILGELKVDNAAQTRVNLGMTQDKLFAQLNSITGDVTDKEITSYPTTPGVYRVIAGAFAGLPVGITGYGILLIFGTGYRAHFYLDWNQILYMSTTEDTQSLVPSGWFDTARNPYSAQT